MAAREVAILAAIGVAALIHLLWSKIGNPSPPPLEEAPDMRGDQGERTGSGTDPRGDVDHVQSGSYIPPEPPDILHASRVGWYEDNPERPECTHVHWVPRAEWEAVQEEPDRRPGWLRVLWP